MLHLWLSITYCKKNFKLKLHQHIVLYILYWQRRKSSVDVGKMRRKATLLHIGGGSVNWNEPLGGNLAISIKILNTLLLWSRNSISSIFLTCVQRETWRDIYCSMFTVGKDWKQLTVYQQGTWCADYGTSTKLTRRIRPIYRHDMEQSLRYIVKRKRQWEGQGV